MALLTRPIRDRLIRNWCAQAPVRGTPREHDFRPVVKLFTPDAGCISLLAELAALRGGLGLPVERDRFFEPSRPSAPMPTRR